MRGCWLSPAPPICPIRKLKVRKRIHEPLRGLDTPEVDRCYLIADPLCGVLSVLPLAEFPTQPRVDLIDLLSQPAGWHHDLDAYGEREIIDLMPWG